MPGVDPEQITIIALLFGIGAAGLRRLWVFGWVYAEKAQGLAEMEKDRNFWRDIALKSMGHVDKALDKAKDA